MGKKLHPLWKQKRKNAGTVLSIVAEQLYDVNQTLKQILAILVEQEKRNG